MWIQSLAQEDFLKEGMVIHSSIFAWRIPWREEPSGLQFMGVSKSWTQLKQLSMQGYGIVLSVLVVYLHDFEADLEHQLTATV